jgi:hypothetical protein
VHIHDSSKHRRHTNVIKLERCLFKQYTSIFGWGCEIGEYALHTLHQNKSSVCRKSLEILAGVVLNQCFSNVL